MRNIGARSDDSSSRFGNATLASLPGCFDGHKPCKCEACGSESTDPAPFKDASSTDIYGGKRPWKRYRRSQINRDTKCPVQKTCLLCHHAFMFSPLKAQHKTLEDYRKTTQGNPADHQGFLRLLANYIAKVEEDPAGYIAALAKGTQSLGRGPIVTESRVHTHKRIFKYTFVHEETYNALYKNGPVLKKRFGELSVDKNKADGTEKKGYWTKGEYNIHLDGHDLHHSEIDEVLTLTETHNDPDFELQKDSALKTFNHMEKRCTESDQNMAKAVGKLSTEDMLEAIRLHTNPNSASSSTAAGYTG